MVLVKFGNGRGNLQLDFAGEKICEEFRRNLAAEGGGVNFAAEIQFEIGAEYKSRLWVRICSPFVILACWA